MTAKLRIRLTAGIVNEYNDRYVFAGGDMPLVPDTQGVYDFPRATVEAMLSDAEYFVGEDSPDAMERGTRRIYACHLRRCRMALEAN